jgi:hypothetical protein
MRKPNVYTAAILDIERVIEGLRRKRNEAIANANRALELADGIQAQIDRLWRQHAGIVDLNSERVRRRRKAA